MYDNKTDTLIFLPISLMFMVLKHRLTIMDSPAGHPGMKKGG